VPGNVCVGGPNAGKCLGGPAAHEFKVVREPAGQRVENVAAGGADETKRTGGPPAHVVVLAAQLVYQPINHGLPGGGRDLSSNPIGGLYAGIGVSAFELADELVEKAFLFACRHSHRRFGHGW
jgi:hypothetical protein